MAIALRLSTSLPLAITVVVPFKFERWKPVFSPHYPIFIGWFEHAGLVEGAEMNLDLVAEAGENRTAALGAEMSALEGSGLARDRDRIVWKDGGGKED